MLRKTLVILVLLLVGTPLASTAQNGPTTEGFPRPASLKRNEVNVRAGPGTRYPTLWVFQRQGWPVALLAKYDNWYKIRDIEGEEGWVYIGMVSGRQTAVISAGEPAVMYARADEKKPVYRLAEGVVVAIENCGESQCQIAVRGDDGWIATNRLKRIN